MKFGIPIFLYIDDRLIEEVGNSKVTGGIMAACFANYIVCEILTRLGYCINLEKSVFEPATCIVFLGFIVDSVNRCFRITKKKKTEVCAIKR